MSLKGPIACATILGAAWLFQAALRAAAPESDEQPARPSAVEAEPEEGFEETTDLVETGPGLSRAAVAAPGAAELQGADARDGATAESPPGTVSGLILDVSGQPLPGGQVLFQVPGSHDDVAWTAADEDGQYELVLAPGPWDVFAPADRAGGGPSLLRVGDVTVRSSQETLFDVAPIGEFSLTGGVFRPDRKNSIVVAELYFAFDPDRLVARAFCRTDDQLHAQHMAERDAAVTPPEGDLGVTRAPGLGCFRFEGLAPELYELRVYMDVGKTYFATFPIDLTNGDVAFDPVPVTEDEFLTRTVFTGL